jgi:hypothetical protein
MARGNEEVRQSGEASAVAGFYYRLSVQLEGARQTQPCPGAPQTADDCPDYESVRSPRKTGQESCMGSGY